MTVVGRGEHDLVFDEVAEAAVLLLADGRFEGDGLLGDLDDFADLAHRQVHFPGDLLAGRLAADLLDELAADPDELVDGLDHMDGDADRAGLIGDGPGDGLADPPGGVSRKLESPAVFELVDGLHEAHVALLDEVQELQAAVAVFLGDGDDQPEVGGDELIFGLFADPLPGGDGADDLAQVGRIQPDVLLNGPDLLLQFPELFGQVFTVLLFPGLGQEELDFLLFLLQPVDGVEPAAEGFDDPFLLARAEVEIPDGSRHLDDDAASGEGLLPVVGDLVQLPAQVVDLADLGQDLVFLFLEFALDDVVFGNVEHLLDDQRVGFDAFFQGQDFVEDETGLAERPDDGFFAALDFAGDGDLALPGKEGDAAHLAQVELDRIGRPLQPLGRQQRALAPAGSGFGLFLVEDFDPVAVERRKKIVEISVLFARVPEGFVYIIKKKIALLAAFGDELRDRVFGKFGVGRHKALLTIAFRPSKKIRFAPPPLPHIVSHMRFMHMIGFGYRPKRFRCGA